MKFKVVDPIKESWVPVKLEITFESPTELLQLWARLNAPTAEIKTIAKGSGWNAEVYRALDRESNHSLFWAVNDICVARNLEIKDKESGRG